MPVDAVFKPDPLLSRTTPQQADGFGVLSLLAPQRPGFQPDRLISPAVAQEASTGGQGRRVAALPAGDPVPGAASPVDPMPQVARIGHEAGDEPMQGGPGPEPATAGGEEFAQLQDQFEQRYRQGFEDGLAEGARLAADMHAEAQQAASDEAIGSVRQVTASGEVALLLQAMSRALQPLLLPDDAATRFEPLKRLALHLAMELVRMELSLSPRVVDGLVHRSLQALQADAQAAVAVELHPQDLALLRTALLDPQAGLGDHAAMLQRVQWIEDSTLARGSVRARSDASTVEDLIEHRLASIVQDLRIQLLQWQRDEAALQARLAAPTEDGEPDA